MRAKGGSLATREGRGDSQSLDVLELCIRASTYPINLERMIQGDHVHANLHETGYYPNSAGLLVTIEGNDRSR